MRAAGGSADVYRAVTRVRPAAGQRFTFFTGHRYDSKSESFFDRINATLLINPFPLSALTAVIRAVTDKFR